MKKQSCVLRLASCAVRMMGFFLVLFLLTTQDAQHTTALAVEVTPHRLELTLPANEVTSGELEITNFSDRTVTVKLKTAPYRHFQPGLSIPSAESWFRLIPQEFTLGPHGSGNVHYEITPPANVMEDSAGEYLAAILIDEVPKNPVITGTPRSEKIEGASGLVTIVPRYAMPVYLQIQNKEQVLITIDSLEARDERPIPDPDIGIFGEDVPDLLVLDLTLKNQGTVHVRPSGTYALINEAGELTHGGTIGRALPLLPTAQMTIPIRMLSPKAGKYRAVVTVNADAEAVGEEELEDLLQEEVRFEVTDIGRVIPE